MRTKTILLSGVVAALSGASLMAQVYSLNAVGYINVSVPTGFSIIADQLYANNQGVAQFLSPLLDSQLLDGNHIGVTLFKFSSANGGYTAVNVAPSGWNAVNGVAATAISLNPGEAIYIYNPTSVGAFTLTFVGQVPQGSLTNVLSSGFNLVSSVVPQTGAIDTVLGLTPTVGDTVFLYNTTTLAYDVLNKAPSGWNTVTGSEPSGTAPSPAVGAGFFYYANIATGTVENWTRTFNVL